MKPTKSTGYRVRGLGGKGGMGTFLSFGGRPERLVLRFLEGLGLVSCTSAVEGRLRVVWQVVGGGCAGFGVIEGHAGLGKPRGVRNVA